jgi:hypothetical protein
MHDGKPSLDDHRGSPEAPIEKILDVTGEAIACVKASIHGGGMDGCEGFVTRLLSRRSQSGLLHQPRGLSF